MGLKPGSRILFPKFITSLNRTKVGLKPGDGFCPGCYKVGFESNQGGIETPKTNECLTILSLFESNQGGIETFSAKAWLWQFDRVWIEPRWDWNITGLNSFPSWVNVWIEPRWDWNCCSADAIEVVLSRLNRTKVGLKHALPVTFSISWTRVWIEPRWDWNFCWLSRM